MSSPWIIPLKESKSPRLTLVTLHNAGGSAGVFMNWVKQLPLDLDLWATQMPGRWERSMEPFVSDIGIAAEQMQIALSQEIQGPYALIGYSLGGLIAFELAHRIQTAGGNQPIHLLTLARNAPHFKSPNPDIDFNLPDREFLEQVQSRYGGVPRQVFEDQDLMKIFPPIIRADLDIYQRYKFKERAPLRLPITAWGGEADPTVTIAGLKMWRELTRGPFQFAQFQGGHFFVEPSQEAFFRLLPSLFKT